MAAVVVSSRVGQVHETFRLPLSFLIPFIGSGVVATLAIPRLRLFVFGLAITTALLVETALVMIYLFLSPV